MAFSNVDTVRAAVNQAVLDILSGVCEVIFGNEDDLTLSTGTAPYVRQRLQFQNRKQLYLGAPKSSRRRGSVIVTIYVPKGDGDGPRDRISEALVSSICGEVIGGATFSESQVLVSGNSGNWSTTGINFPFYFDQLS